MKRVLLTLVCALSALAQWPTDPAQNLLICNHTGEQAMPKIAATSDGGCYITWWDLSSGNYDVYLQKLDADGVPQWTDPCGILVSDHPQDTWLTDWDMAVDDADNCIIAVNDTRDGDDRDITAYKIGPQQEFLWGADGIALSNNDGFEADPRILPMDNGDAVFAWQEETSIHVRKLDSVGVDVFNPPTISFTQSNGASIPRLAEIGNSGFALSYLAQQGTLPTSPRHLYVRAYNDDGSNRWAEGGIPIMTTSGIGIQMRPDVIADGNGGAYSYWYDARGNVHHVYVQHIENDGVAHWTANGLQVDLTASELQMSPSAVLADSGIVLFYQTANTNQSQGGVQAQYVSFNGDLLWNTGGVTIEPLSAEPCFNVRAHRQHGNYGVFYSQYAPGSALNTVLQASQLNATGAFEWTPPIVDLCSVVSEKGRPFTCVNPFDQILAAWPDSRSEVMDIYVQNVNADGTLGPNSVLPPEIRIVFPAEGQVVHSSEIELIFEVDNFIIDPDFGDGYVLIQVNDQDAATANEVAPYPLTLHQGENLILVEILDLDFLPLEPRAMDSVHVTYEPLNPGISIISGGGMDSVEIQWTNFELLFEVGDFVVADSGGDGHLWLTAFDTEAGEYFQQQAYFTTQPIDVSIPNWDVWNEIVLALVDHEGADLDPRVADTIYVKLFEIDADDAVLPFDFALSAYPNPFNSAVAIKYDVPRPGQVALEVFDVTGRKVTTLVNAAQVAGRHSILWTAEAEPSGVYFVRLSSGIESASRKIMLLK